MSTEIDPQRVYVDKAAFDTVREHLPRVGLRAMIGFVEGATEISRVEAEATLGEDLPTGKRWLINHEVRAGLLLELRRSYRGEGHTLEYAHWLE